MTNSTAPTTSTNFTTDGHFSINTFRIRYPSSFLTNGPGAGSPLDISLRLTAQLSQRVLTFPNHRDGTHVSRTAVFGLNVLEHRVSGERSRVPCVPVKILNTLCVAAGKADERRALIAPTDSVHDTRLHDICRYSM